MNYIENKQLVSLENIDHGFSAETDVSQGIQSIPEDVLLFIFSQTGCKELGKLAQVSKNYLKMTSLPALWKATLLKELPNLLDDYPCLNSVPADKIIWKKVYLDECSSNIDVKRWEGPHVINVAHMYKTDKGLTTRKKNINLDLNSNELTLNIFKKIALNQLELSYKPSQIDVFLGTHAIRTKNNSLIKEIKVSGPCTFPTFIDFTDNDKMSVYICIKKEAPLPEEILPKEWEVGANEQNIASETTSTIQNTPTKKKKKPLRENCIMM